MSAPLVFQDTETTGLNSDRDQIWEYAGVRIDPDGERSELHLFIAHDTSRWPTMPKSFLLDLVSRYDGATAVSRKQASFKIHEFTQGAHVIGCVPDFDAVRLRKMFLETLGLEPKWHYHLIDVENLAVGCLAAKGVVLSPPWHSEDISRAVGVEPAGPGVRHTAMGDVLWAMDIYRAVMGKLPGE